MGSVRADWHLPAIEMDTSDPFGESPRIPVPEASPRADRPGGDRPTPLAELVLEEAVLDARGITCSLKDRDWAHPSCSICPERGDVERHELCRVGLAQEAAVAEIVGANE